ncbi:Serine/threonine-protein kinase nrc-2 [Tetrabaena socialis]|uniref:non-specific serine/threonine protein kinase n=1 Tax=Tetrabaena socialis TaxID=47790 RepID=A0A2J7ZJK5_9CHLO|nr:Serine/threonine-protein kinase nrc-2 [Tetrabaena socialis]|eukprot:PNH00448.1 Serine/threonine-protein kinase nrc-2 [Tetrabaena socialis]
MLPFCFSTPAFAPDADSALLRARALNLGPELGQGSICRVFEAECPATQQRFAVKRVPLPAALAARRAVFERLAREAAAAAALAAAPGGPCTEIIVRHHACVYDSTEEELYRGPCLARLRRQHPGGQLPEARVRRIVAAVAAALGCLHGVGLLAVDLKAENVVSDPAEGDPDRVVLVDLDLCHDVAGGRNHCGAAAAAAAAAGDGSGAADAGAGGERRWGTLEYLSYEVMQDGAAAYSPASDWWALGVLSYELLYGRAPWSAPNLEALLHRVATFSPPFPGPEEGGPQVSPGMQQLVRSLLRHRPEVRLGSRGGVEEVLAHAALQASCGAA